MLIVAVTKLSNEPSLNSAAIVQQPQIQNQNFVQNCLLRQKLVACAQRKLQKMSRYPQFRSHDSGNRRAY